MDWVVIAMNVAQGLFGWVVVYAALSDRPLSVTMLAVFAAFISSVITFVVMQRESQKGKFRELFEIGADVAILGWGALYVSNQMGSGWLSSPTPVAFIFGGLMIALLNHGAMLAWVLQWVSKLLVLLSLAADKLGDLLDFISGYSFRDGGGFDSIAE